MSDLYKNKYRIASARLQNWDYGSAAAYFVTICTQNRTCFLGEINDRKMKLSEAGVIADICWHAIKNHAKNVELGEYVIMPNHVHGIVIINGNTNDNDVAGVVGGVETLHATSLPRQPRQPPPPDDPPKNEQMANISPKSNSLSTIIRSYKSAVTKHCNRLGYDFAWQSRFHDHIIRDEISFQTIAAYIQNNPTIPLACVPTGRNFAEYESGLWGHSPRGSAKPTKLKLLSIAEGN